MAQKALKCLWRLQAQQRYFSYRAMLVAIVSQNSCGVSIAHLSHDMLQNGVSHRCARVKVGAKKGVSHHFSGVLTSLKKYRAIWGYIGVSQR